MARTLYGFGQGSSGLRRTGLATPQPRPREYYVRVYSARQEALGVDCNALLGPYPTREEAAIVSRHIMSLCWCVAIVELMDCVDSWTT